MKRSQLGILAALLVAGCSTTQMSQEGETVITVPFMAVGLMPSWDQRSPVRTDGAPRLRKSSPCLEFLLTLPLTPLFLPAWEEERPPVSARDKRETLGGYWRNRIGTIVKRKKKKKTIINPISDELPPQSDAKELDAEAELEADDPELEADDPELEADDPELEADDPELLDPDLEDESE